MQPPRTGNSNPCAASWRLNLSFESPRGPSPSASIRRKSLAHFVKPRMRIFRG